MLIMGSITLKYTEYKQTFMINNPSDVVIKDEDEYTGRIFYSLTINFIDIIALKH